MKKRFLYSATIILVLLCFTHNNDSFSQPTPIASTSEFNIDKNLIIHKSDVDISVWKSFSFFDKMQDKEATILTVKEVELSDYYTTNKSIAEGETININLCDDKNYSATITRTDKRVTGANSITAELDDYMFSYLIISTSGDQSLAVIRIPEKNKRYNIVYEEKMGKHYLIEFIPIQTDINQIDEPIKHDQKKIHCSKEFEEYQRRIQQLDEEDLRPDDLATINLMILYTEKAANDAPGGIDQYIDVIVSQAQQAFTYSYTVVDVNLVHTQEVDYDCTSAGIITTFNRLIEVCDLSTSNNNFLCEAHGLRRIHGADLVSLLIGNQIFGGVAHILNTFSGNPNRAFSVVGLGSDLWFDREYILAHELGHNFGAGHHYDQNQQQGPGPIANYAAGYRWPLDDPQYSSVMSYPWGSEYDDNITTTPVLAFSTPLVYHPPSESLIGDADKADNARVIRETKHQISEYMPVCLVGFSGQYPWHDLTPDEEWGIVDVNTYTTYAVFDVVEGNEYEWSLCPEDGGISSFNSELTLRTHPENEFITYNHHFCGNDGKIIWNADFTGQVRVIVTEEFCSQPETFATLAYRISELIEEPDPQIEIQSISLHKPSFNPGETAHLTVRLADQLTGASVTYSISGGSTQELNDVGDGFYQSSFTAPGNTGNYTVNVTAEKDGYLPAAGSMNFNVVQPNEGHDFAVTHLFLDNTTYDINDNIQVTTMVKNVGTVAQSNVPVLFSLFNPNGVIVHQLQETVSLAAGQSIGWQKNLFAPAGSENGSYMVEVRTMLETDSNPENDFMRKTVYMGDAPEFDQYLLQGAIVLNYYGDVDTFQDYTVELLQIYNAYGSTGEKAARIKVTKGSYHNIAVCLFNDIVFFDEGNLVLELTMLNTTSKYAVFGAHIPTNDMIVTPNKLYVDAATSESFFITLPFAPYSFSALFTDDADEVNDWLNIESVSGPHCELSVNVPLSTQRRLFDFWLRESNYMHYLQIEVTEPHNVEAISLLPGENAVLTGGETIEIVGTFKNSGGYFEPGIFIKLDIHGPYNYHFTSHQFINLSIDQQSNVTFYWNTLGVSDGEYTISVEAIVENDPYNNNSITHSVTVEGAPAVLPVSPPSLSFFEIIVDQCATQSYQLTGFNLSDNISVQAPTGFLISTEEGSSFSQSLIVEHNEGMASQEIYVKFCPENSQSYEGFISNESPGAETAHVSVSGIGVSQAVLPYVVTHNITEIASSSALSGGNVIHHGGADVVVRGVVWSTEENPDLQNNIGFTVNGDGIGEFDSFITGLQPSTGYYLRAYATNSTGTGYGNQQYFETLPPDDDYDLNGTTDIDGNDYPAVTIGQQVWMTNNLRTTRYADGSAIPTDLSDSQWANTISGAYSIYPHSQVSGINSNTAMVNAYGKLYNWYATVNPRGLCPEGWSVPSDDDWTTLSDYLINNYSDINSNSIGRFLKSCRTVNSPLGGECSTNQHPRWDYDDSDYGTDDFGFSALPGGYKHYNNGTYSYMGWDGFWFSSTESTANRAYSTELRFDDGRLRRNNWSKNDGFSIRCLRDKLTNIATLSTNPVALNFGTIAMDYCNTKSYQLIGENLKAPVNISAPSPFLISLNEETGYASSLIITPSNGEIDQTIYVKFCPNEDKLFSGEIMHSSNDVDTWLVVVLGKGIPEVLPPAVITHAVTDITYNSAKSGGNVTCSGGSDVTERGVVWGPTEEVSIHDNEGMTTDGQGLGLFESQITGLSAATDYFVKAYATNSAGTDYGAAIDFSTTSVYQLSLLVSPESVGLVEGAGNYYEGEEITVNATANHGWQFIHWVDHVGQIVSELASFVYTMPASNATLTAVFESDYPYCPGMPTITDADGNVYQTVLIGDQCWTRSNLRVTQYNNGNPINTGLTNSEWSNTEDGAYAIYPYNNWNAGGINSPEEMVDAYGKLYNWYAVDDERGLCPEGWRVPSDDDWTQLTSYISGGWWYGGHQLSSCRQVNSIWDQWYGYESCNTTEHPRWDELFCYPDIFAYEEDGQMFIGVWGWGYCLEYLLEIELIDATVHSIETWHGTIFFPPGEVTYYVDEIFEWALIIIDPVDDFEMMDASLYFHFWITGDYYEAYIWDYFYDDWKSDESNSRTAHSKRILKDYNTNSNIGQEDSSRFYYTDIPDEYFFSALPASNRRNNGLYGWLGQDAYFWTSTSHTATQSGYRYIWVDEPGIHGWRISNNNGYSVRCILDEDYEVGIPELLNLTNETISDGETECFDALQTITVSDFTVEPGGSATLIAGESIHLLPGTTVQHGGYLLAHIAAHEDDYCGIPRAIEIAKEPVTSKEEDVVSADFNFEIRENGFFKLYPNPTDGTFTLELTTAEIEFNITVEVHSVLGGRLFIKELPPQRLHSLSLEGQQPGMYIIRVMKGDKVGVERLIKR